MLSRACFQAAARLLEHHGRLPEAVSTQPSHGESRPAARLSRVVLLQPEGPTRATVFAGRDAQVDVFEHALVAEAVGDAVDVQAHRLGLMQNSARIRPCALIGLEQQVFDGQQAADQGDDPGHRGSRVEMACGDDGQRGADAVAGGEQFTITTTFQAVPSAVIQPGKR